MAALRRLQDKVVRAQLASVFWLIVLGTLWGSSYLFIKVIVSEVPFMTLVAGRLALSAAVMWLLVAMTRRQLPRGWALWGRYAVMGFLSGALPYVLISWGEKSISSGMASLLQSTMPIFTVLLAAWLGRGEELSIRKVAGVIVGFVGVGLMMLPDWREGERASLIGQLAIVASSLSYAGATLFARARLRGQPALLSTTGQLTTGALMVLPASLWFDKPLGLTPSWAALACWLGLAVLGTVIAYVIYYALIERTSATFVSTVTYIIPVNGLILGAIVLGEPITGWLLGALVLILLGVLLVRN